MKWEHFSGMNEFSAQFLGMCSPNEHLNITKSLNQINWHRGYWKWWKHSIYHILWLQRQQILRHASKETHIYFDTCTETLCCFTYESFAFQFEHFPTWNGVSWSENCGRLCSLKSNLQLSWKPFDFDISTEQNSTFASVFGATASNFAK